MFNRIFSRSVLGFANVSTIIEHALNANYTSIIAMIAGLIIFIIVVSAIYAKGEKKLNI